MNYFLILIFCLPLLCQAQLNTPKPATKPTTTTKPVAKKLYTDAGTVNDIDGNIYHAIKIGTQVWMVENLRTSRYNDGSVIPNVTDNTAWANLETGAWCYYDNISSNNLKYGKLYNWYAVNTGKLAPVGWHIPSDADWQILIDYLGGENQAGGKMKSTLLWNSPNIGAINSGGFSGVPGGYSSMMDGAFGNIEKGGYWWSATEHGTRYAWHRFLIYTNADAWRDNYGKQSGMSVRCIKD